ncbi:MAG: hypothetical protein Q8P02_01495 [Candidatus Micrarchaeota archaeon]|nr:hypothetical protein [Candidatus Micrarchaeota archaeon]
MSHARIFKNYKVLLLAGLFLASIYLLFLQDGNPSTVDLHLGIEFIGGVRIPVTLDRALDSEQMGVMVDTLKQRLNKFGLTQVVVRPLGDKEIIVELPKAQADVIARVENILREQGRFEAIIAGKQALNGSEVIPTGIGGAGGEQVNRDGTWQLTFSVTAEGNLRFARVAAGNLGENVYMFLDRPENAALLVPQDMFETGPDILDALAKEGDDIGLFYIEDFNASGARLLNGAYTQVLLPENVSQSHPDVVAALVAAGFENNRTAEKRIVFTDENAIRPRTFGFGITSTINRWDAIGLKSAPTLQVEPAKFARIEQYSITGSADGITPQELHDNAALEVRELKSVLSGGRLPVGATVGSYYNIAPSLGNQFLTYSLYGIALAVVLVSLVVTLRYRRLELILPIILTNVVEIVVLMALVGSIGTLDLAAMAGVIALIGTGVDNQIVITDELLKKRGEQVSAKRKLKDAFFIVFTTAGVALASMLPLLMSGIVEVMGFAIATILGVILGVLVSRPAYSVIVEELFAKENN